MATKVLSIEVGIESTKVCEVDYGKKSPYVYNTLMFSNPENSVEDGIIRDKDAFSTVLQENLDKAGIKNSNVVFTILSNKIATREVIIPYVSDKKIQGIINSSSKEYFPMDLSDYTISYRVIEKKNHKDEKNISVLVLAAPVELIRSYYAIARNLKLHIINMDYIGNSYYQVMTKEVGKGVNIAVHINELDSIVTIIDNGTLALQRIIGFGTRNLTDAVMNEPILNKETKEDAFSYLCNETVLNYQFSKNISLEKEPVSYQVGHDGFNKAKAEQRAKEDVTLVVQDLLRNIARILDYYNSKFAGRNIAAIYVTGLGAKVQGISRLMNNEIGLEVKNVENYYSIHTTKESGHKKENITEYVACIGGVLHPIGFKLPELLDSQVKKSNKKVMLAIFSLSILLSIVLVAISYLAEQSAENEKVLMETKIAAKQYVNGIYADNASVKNRFSEFEKLYKASTTPNEFLNDLITELETQMPNTITVQSMEVVGDKISLTCASLDKASIGQFLINLQKIPFINLPITNSISETELDNGLIYYTFDMGFEYAVDGTEDKSSFTSQQN